MADEVTNVSKAKAKKHLKLENGHLELAEEKVETKRKKRDRTKL
jgi:hypothetical protein